MLYKKRSVLGINTLNRGWKSPIGAVMQAFPRTIVDVEILSETCPAVAWPESDIRKEVITFLYIYRDVQSTIPS